MNILFFEKLRVSDGLVAMVTYIYIIALYRFFVFVKQTWTCQNVYTLCNFFFAEAILFTLKLQYFVKSLTGR